MKTGLAVVFTVWAGWCSLFRWVPTLWGIIGLFLVLPYTSLEAHHPRLEVTSVSTFASTTRSDPRAPPPSHPFPCPRPPLKLSHYRTNHFPSRIATASALVPRTTHRPTTTTLPILVPGSSSIVLLSLYVRMRKDKARVFRF
ncbi:hypothetical protein DFP72DRAFT_501659 [Ephemerocybe angulata]|uniref:Uncharacterized protein n=1 Tax=Ephemerocybe angulata TaxID=980116 RepID=A0A8H6M0I4_9AGAR|nr:hypothetical protein DFP72DRAFT_501659 [Tulosesus angulatus]